MSDRLENRSHHTRFSRNTSLLQVILPFPERGTCKKASGKVNGELFGTIGIANLLLTGTDDAISQSDCTPPESLFQKVCSLSPLLSGSDPQQNARQDHRRAALCKKL